MSIQIAPNSEITVRVPRLMPKFLIEKFVNEKSSWIEKTLEKVRKNQHPKSSDIDEGFLLPYMGKEYPIHFGIFNKIGITDKFNIPLSLKFRVKKEILDWYKKQAKTLITDRVNHFAGEMKMTYKSIYFSDTSSKWGTCMHDNTLQFNWRLIMAPILIIDYVVVHELAHTKEKNHKDGFWRIVKLYKPAYKQYIKWLKDNSQRLHNII